MRDEWRMAVREPFVVDDESTPPTGSEHDEAPLVAVVSIVAVAAMALATIGAMIGGCSLSPDGGTILGAAALALLLAFAGTCVVTYQRRTWSHAATTFTCIALVFVVVGFADRTSEANRLAETGSACRTDFDGD
jgi:hypothetical protein